jgi:hypothetical protein
MVRVPSTVVGVFCAVALDLLVFALARLVGRPELLTALLPFCALAGGFVAGRWAGPLALVPGFAVGIITVAVRLGLGLGLGLGILGFVWPPLALLELVGATVGGMTGLTMARRARKFSVLSFEF